MFMPPGLPTAGALPFAARVDAAGKRPGQSGIFTVDVAAGNSELRPVLEEFYAPELFHLRLVDWR